MQKQVKKNYQDFTADIEKQNKEVIDAFEAMKRSDITLQDYMMVLLNKLEPYIKFRIAAKHRTAGAEFNDLVSAGQEAIIRECVKYDPHQSMPTSFFTVYIDAAMKEEVKNPNITSHYSTIITALDKIAKENGFENCVDPKLSFQKLCILSSHLLKKDNKISTKTLREAVNIKKCESVSLDTQIGEFIESPFETPEEVFLRNEKTKHLNKMLENISPLDLYILQETVCKELTSIRSVVAALNTPELQMRFNLHKKIDAGFVNKRQKLTLRMLRYADTTNYLEMEDHSADMFAEVYEQATMDEIEEAVQLDCVFDTEDLNKLSF